MKKIGMLDFIIEKVKVELELRREFYSKHLKQKGWKEGIAGKKYVEKSLKLKVILDKFELLQTDVSKYQKSGG